MSLDRPGGIGHGEQRRRAQRQKALLSAVAGVIGFVILTVLVLPSPWAPVAGLVLGAASSASVYGIITGRQRGPAPDLITAQASTEALTQQLHQLRTSLSEQSHRLPPTARESADQACDALEEIIQRWDTLEAVPEQQDAVYASLTRYFPQTIELFLALPDSAKPRHAGEFDEQIELINDAATRTRDTVVARDLRRLRSQTWLLQESLQDPAEKLFRDNGL